MDDCQTDRLTRRSIIHRLSLLAVASRLGAAAGLEGPTVHHVSLGVSDLTRSSDFYQRVFGCLAQKRDDGSILLPLEKGHIILRRGGAAGRVDHIAIGIEGFTQESITRDLKSRGAEPTYDAVLAGLNVKDPDGLPVQLTSNATYSGKPAGFPASTLDHVSMYTSDLKRSIEFYQRVFGFPIMRQGETGAQLSVGSGYITLRSGRTPLGVDHFAIGIDGFNRESIIRDLRSRGVEPADDPIKGLHVKDPDGFAVQVIANDNRGRA